MKKHILLVDEDKEDLRLFMQAFEEMEVGCKCTYTGSCSHASQMLEYILPDSIFVRLDPDITEGLEFVRNIKRNKKLRRIPIVVYSSHMPYYNFIARGHGADHCMLQPQATGEIRRIMEAMLLLDSGKKA